MLECCHLALFIESLAGCSTTLLKAMILKADQDCKWEGKIASGWNADKPIDRSGITAVLTCTGSVQVSMERTIGTVCGGCLGLGVSLLGHGFGQDSDMLFTGEKPSSRHALNLTFRQL